MLWFYFDQFSCLTFLSFQDCQSQCTTTQEQQCQTINEQQCTTVNEQVRHPQNTYDEQKLRQKRDAQKYIQQVFDGHIKFVETLWLVTIVKKLFMTSAEFARIKISCPVGGQRLSLMKCRHKVNLIPYCKVFSCKDKHLQLILFSLQVT